MNSMQNDLTLKNNSVFIHFNPSQGTNPWGSIVNQAQNYLVHFLNKKEYELISLNFDLLVEKEIDSNKQRDFISTASHFGIPKKAVLTLHLNQDLFIQFDDDNKYKITLNAVLFLLQYWKDHLKIPKNIPLEEIIIDLSKTLQSEHLLLDNKITSELFVKIANPFHFDFIQHHFQGIREADILFDTNHIEQFLNNRLYKTDYGKTIHQIFFSYDIFDFYSSKTKEYIDLEKKYRYGKNKDLYFMEQYDSNLLDGKTKKEQLDYLQKGILEAITRIKDMKRKPKDFNIDLFYSVMDTLLTAYNNTYSVY